jgi:hypothetical protein
VEAAPPPTGGSALPAPDESDFLSQPGPDQAAAQKSERKTSPVLIILLVIVLVIALAAAGVFLFAPELIGMAMLAAFILA